MSITDLVPVQYRMAAMLIGAAVALSASFGAGWAVNGWRMDGGHQRELAAEKGRYDLLTEKVREQNAAVATMSTLTVAADQRREVAERFASDVVKGIGRRSASVAASKETTCDGVLREAWRTP